MAKAEQELQELSEEKPQDTVARIRWADAMLSQGKLLSAQEVLTAGLRDDPDSPALRQAFGKLLTLLAATERSRGATGNARFKNLLLTALTYAPGLLGIIDQLESLNVEQRDLPDDTWNSIGRILDAEHKRTPNSPLLLTRKAWFHYVQGDIDKATATMDRACEIAPGLAIRYAAMLDRLDRHEEAQSRIREMIALFEQRLKDKPKSVGTRIQIANGYEYLGDWKKSRTVINEGIELSADPLLKAKLVSTILRQFSAVDSDDREQNSSY